MMAAVQSRRTHKDVSALASPRRLPYHHADRDAPVIDPSSSPAIVAPFSTSESA
jgi:hypothetical protein